MEGTVIREYKTAIDDNIDIIVKIDSGSQMKPSLINKFANSLINYFIIILWEIIFMIFRILEICIQFAKLKVVLIRSKFY